MLGAALLYVWLPENVKLKEQEAASRETYLIVVAMAAMSVAGVFFVRQAMVSRGWEILANHPDDRSALMRWFTGNVVLFALCESIVLYGMLLRFIGATLMQALPFYAVGIFLLLMSYPRRP